ncbi:MAG: right-handed parallel beta-helix repeat-containing protein, partial [bacterium]
MKRQIFVSLVVLGLLAFKPIWAETYVSGNVSGNWTTGGSPYIVTADATVQNGTTLVIDPNVEVRFSTNTSLIVYGNLKAIGTLNGTITFTGLYSTPGLWQSIKFSGINARGTISYCDIGYAKQAVYLENVLDIEITHNYIHHNKGYDGGNPGGIGCGIYLYSSTHNTISENTISNNTGGQGGTGADWGWGSPGYPGGIGCGIYLSSSLNNIISKNTIYDNRGGTGGTGTGDATDGQGSIGCGIYLSSSSGNTILENSISNSMGGRGYYGFENGYGIYIDSNSYTNTIGPTNTYNTEPIHYYYNQSGIIIENQTLTLAGSGSTNLGRIVLINCQNFTIRNNIIAGDIGQDGLGGIGCGIYLYSSTHNTISRNIISNNIGGRGINGYNYNNDYPAGTGGIGCGIYLHQSSYNVISENTISEISGGEGGWACIVYGCEGSGGRGGIGCGIYLFSSINNIFSQNTMVNTKGGQGGRGGGGGTWFDGSPGICGQGYGIYIDQNSYNNAIDSLNTYNTESIHYYYGTNSLTIENQTLTLLGSGSTNLGRIVLINCSNFTIRNNFIAGGIGENGQTGGYTGSGGSGGIGCGIYLYNSTNTTITNNTISNNQGGRGGTGGSYGNSGGSGGIGCGIYLSFSTNSTISENVISNNIGGQGGMGGCYGPGGTSGQGYGIYSISNSFSTIHYNNLLGNKNGDLTNGYGVYHDGSFGTISATYNWWGANSGPYHGTSNPSGQGDKVSDWVDYRPWIAQTIMITPTSGLVGTIVTIEGQGFATESAISIDFGTNQTIAQTTSDEYGTFSTTFIVDTQPICTKTITATDSYGNYAITLFKLNGTPKISLQKQSPASVITGSTITYTLIYKNIGTNELLDVMLVDCLANGNVVSFDIGTLAIGQEGSRTLEYFATGLGLITNYAT